MTKQEWVGKMINWELCKKLKFDYTDKSFMHNQESVPDNKTLKFLWSFEMQAGSSNLGQTTRPSDSQLKKKKKREAVESWILPFWLIIG